jgi:hypothetical protein
MTDLNNLVEELNTEVVDLTDFMEESTGGGAWPKGWYVAEIIEGYATRKGKQFVSEDTPSKDGSSRNLRLCIKVGDGKTERTMNMGFNYRTSDFTAERLEHIKELRKEFAEVKSWPDKDAQRSSLAVAKLAQLQKAIGFPFKNSAVPYIGQRVDVYLKVTPEGFNEVSGVAAFGSKVKT